VKVLETLKTTSDQTLPSRQLLSGVENLRLIADAVDSMDQPNYVSGQPNYISDSEENE
jgi:hypothetical protein